MVGKYYDDLTRRLLRSGDRSFHVNAPADFWEKEGLEFIKDLFDQASTEVPAYASELESSHLVNYKIQQSSDLAELPILNKDTYLKKWEMRALVPGSISEVTTYSSSSGSTGEPVYVPRAALQDQQYAYIAENLLNHYFEVGGEDVLCLVGFGFGVWIGGIFTYKVLNSIGEKRGGISVVPIGPNKELFYTSLRKLARNHRRIILMGYPPFIKDLVLEASEHGIDLKKYDLRILTAAESFSERFRERVLTAAGIKDRYCHMLNIYGTVELGTMAHETPVANLIKKMANENPDVFREIFGDIKKAPTLCQYYPFLTYFEQVDGRLVASGHGSYVPLVRYDLKDSGGVIAFDEMVEKMRVVGINIHEEMQKMGLTGSLIKLPFVYVYERNDMSVSLFGIIIYAEHVRLAMESNCLADKVTGRLSMTVIETKALEQQLVIHVELRSRAEKTEELTREIRDCVVQVLRKHVTEYRYLCDSANEDTKKQILPNIILHEYQASEYFRPGVKQKWVF